MKKFLLKSIALQTLTTILLTLFVIMPRWYFGLGRGPQLFMEITIPIIIVMQIVASILWNKKSIIIGILPIVIPICYYFTTVRELIIAYM